MILLVESQYFAPVILFKMLSKGSHIEFDVYENYQKMSFRNRCVVAGGKGPVNLSVPLLEGRNQRRLVKEVQIDNRRPWQGQHWKTILSCYNRSPWFSFYCDDMEELYRQPFQFLVDWNLACFEWAVQQLGIVPAAGFTQQYEEHYDEEKYLDCRNRLLPKNILQQFPQPVSYRQVFEERTGFIPHLSILDLLFCEGKNARQILLKG